MPPPGLTPGSYHFNLYGDYHQLYLEDCQRHDERIDGLIERAGETAAQWAARMQRLEHLNAWIVGLLNNEAQARHLGTAPGTLCILTASIRVVPVTVEIRSTPPSDARSAWNYVIEASLELASGCLVIYGLNDEEEHRIMIPAGTYRARMQYGGIPSVSVDELDGDDHYLVTLWPAPFASVRVLHDDGSFR